MAIKDLFNRQRYNVVSQCRRCRAQFYVHRNCTRAAATAGSSTDASAHPICLLSI